MAAVRDAFLRNLIWLGCVGALIVLDLSGLGIAPHGAVPAFQHDWIWPAARSQCMSLVAAGFEPWHSEGLGIPAAYPESYIYHSLTGSACVAFGPRWGLLGVLFLALLVAAAGAVALYRRVIEREGLPYASSAAVALGALAVANPVVLNKLQAGHLKFIIGYSVLPWIAAFSIRKSSGAVYRTGALLGIATMEPQFYVFGMLIAAGFQVYAGGFSLPLLAGIAAIGLGMNLTLVFPAFSHPGMASFGTLSPALFWQQAQSGTLSEAVRMLGYTAHYAERLLPRIVLDAYWIIPALGVTALILNFRWRYAWLFALAAIGIIITSAWNTVLAPIWTAAYSSAPALALFRELYNAMVLTLIAFIALCAIAVSAFKRRYGISSVLLCGALIALSAVIAVKSTTNIPTYTPQSVQPALDKIAATRSVSRFAVLPGTAPVTNGKTASAGYSPWYFSMPNHPAFFSPTPDNVEIYTDALLRDGQPQGRIWLDRAGVGYLQYLHGWSTRVLANTEPSTRRAIGTFFSDYSVVGEGVTRTPATLVAVEQFSAQPGSLADRYSGARDIRSLSGGRSIALRNFTSDVSPGTGWGLTPLFPIMPRWVFTEPLGVFTLRDAAALRIAPSLVVAGDASGGMHSKSCRMLRRLDAHFKIFSCAENPVFEGKAPIVVSFARSGATIPQSIPPQGAAGQAALLSYEPWHMTAQVKAARGSAVVLRQSYDEGWTASIPGARHVMVDGYANAWLAPTDVDGTVTFTFAPSRVFFVCLALSLATLLGSAIGIFYSRGVTA